jgi:cell division protease FtsH
VFDFIPETTPTVASGRVVFSSVGIAVADGAAHATEPPILPEETRQEIDEFLELFLNPGRRAELGVTQPRGLLLYGPPGNGKTMIARHLAGRMRCNFLALSSGDFTSRWAGVAAERIKKLFAQARLRQPCVIFIDEIDGVVPKRSSGSGSGVERDQASTVAALLTELDGFDGGGDIFLIAATNRREAIDEALLRPGRLDRMIEVSCPGRDERQALLAASFARVEPHEVDLGWAANETFGFSCAQIVAAVRDSKLLVHRRSAAAASKEGCQITNADFREAVDCIRYGAAIRPDSMEARLLESAQAITAWHEAGHAVLSAALLGEIPERVTIVPRGHFGGYVRATREDQMRRAFSRTRTSCINELAMLLGGGIAESKLSDEHTSGVSSDRESAFQLAYRMVVSWGMGPFEAQVEGLLSRKGEASTAASSSGAVVREVSELLKEADVLARGELDLHEKLLQQIAQLLLEKKELDRSDLDNVLGEIKKQP